MIRRCLIPIAFLIVLTAASAGASGPAATSIQDKTAGMTPNPGFFEFFWDVGGGQVWLRVEEDQLDREFLLVTGLATGIGSNDVGLDRTQLGDQKLVQFRRVGPKLFLVQLNTSYRAGESDNPAERKAVQDGFAESVLWGFDIAAQGTGAVLVDFTPLLLSDQRNISQTLEQQGEGKYQIEPTRSAVYLPRTRNFPRNSEFEATLTFRGGPPGAEIRSVVPTPELISVRQHVSLIQLPEPDFSPRPYHVMSGYWPVEFRDYTVPIGEDLVRRVIPRHRLEKRDPGSAVSLPVRPIVYYVDPGIPEPVRSAVIEGGKWWSEAFEAIGFRDAFHVELLPADADPMDVRYNVINWLHRSTRGWSYGDAIVDPRTGEILKGHVNLGSLRLRHDYLIAEGLLSPYAEGVPNPDPMLEMALARIRQLSAHEIGHTLGLIHNFAASTNARASVMDYPHPLLALAADGTVQLDDAYATGVGAWDKLAIAYGYQQFPDGTNEMEALDRLLEAGYHGHGLRYIADADARPAGGAHPFGHLWDNGTDAVEELKHLLRVRKQALAHFSLDAIRGGRPLASLEEALVPVYYLHRYQIEAAAKLLAGLSYEYSVRNAWSGLPAPVAPELQRRALQALLDCLQPEELAIPERILGLVPPRPIGYPATRELVQRRTDPAFDPLAAAEALADHVLALVLHPGRASRLVEYGARVEGGVGLIEVLDRLLAATWQAEVKSGFPAEIQRAVNYRVLDRLMELSSSPAVPAQARAIALGRLDGLKDWLEAALESNADENQAAAYRYAIKTIERHGAELQPPDRSRRLPMPPGQPIG